MAAHIEKVNETFLLVLVEVPVCDILGEVIISFPVYDASGFV